jgi:hypothetical protein
MAEGTWQSREKALLEAIARGEETDGVMWDWQRVAAEARLDEDDARLGLRRLYEADYITGVDETGISGEFRLHDIRLLEKGLVEVGVWPADPYDALLGVVDSQLQAEEDPERASRLSKLKDAIGEVGREVITRVLTEIAKGHLPQ